MINIYSVMAFADALLFFSLPMNIGSRLDSIDLVADHKFMPGHLWSSASLAKEQRRVGHIEGILIAKYHVDEVLVRTIFEVADGLDDGIGIGVPRNHIRGLSSISVSFAILVVELSLKALSRGSSPHHNMLALWDAIRPLVDQNVYDEYDVAWRRLRHALRRAYRAGVALGEWDRFVKKCRSIEYLLARLTEMRSYAYSYKTEHDMISFGTMKEDTGSILLCGREYRKVKVVIPMALVDVLCSNLLMCVSPGKDNERLRSQFSLYEDSRPRRRSWLRRLKVWFRRLFWGR